MPILPATHHTAVLRSRGLASSVRTRQLRETLPWCASFALVFGVCYGGASWLASRHTSLPAWNLPFESHVRFVPSLAIVYLSIVPAMMLAPFVFRTRAEIAPFAITLCVETLIATIFFVLMPQKTAFIRPPVTGWIGPLFDFANALNLESNELPSLHVAFAVTAAWAYGSSSLWSGRFTKLRTWLWSLWCLTVISSAWLMWEHHFLEPNYVRVSTTSTA